MPVKHSPLTLHRTPYPTISDIVFAQASFARNSSFTVHCERRADSPAGSDVAQRIARVQALITFVNFVTTRTVTVDLTASGGFQRLEGATFSVLFRWALERFHEIFLRDTLGLGVLTRSSFDHLQRLSVFQHVLKRKVDVGQLANGNWR